MSLDFIKMHGCGNDYIFVDCFEREVDAPDALAVRLSDRHFGVGGDGLVLIYPSDIADARMAMYNADGSVGRMCGNAIRCIAKYLYETGRVLRREMRIDTQSGVKQLWLTLEGEAVSAVRVDMGAPEILPLAPPQCGGGYGGACISMGNPHCVILTADIDRLDLPKIGPTIENHAQFPDRTNVEFVEVVGKNLLKMRVWERGSGETLACGTGACASAVAAVLGGFCEKNTDITVCLIGGRLTINVTDTAVYMTGPCQTVFTGTIS